MNAPRFPGTRSATTESAAWLRVGARLLPRCAEGGAPWALDDVGRRLRCAALIVAGISFASSPRAANTPPRSAALERVSLVTECRYERMLAQDTVGASARPLASTARHTTPRSDDVLALVAPSNHAVPLVETVAADPAPSVVAPSASKHSASEVARMPPTEVPARAPDFRWTSLVVSPVSAPSGPAAYLTRGDHVLMIGNGPLALAAFRQPKRSERERALCPDKACASEGRRQIDAAETRKSVPTVGVGVSLGMVCAGAYAIVTKTHAPLNSDTAHRSGVTAPLPRGVAFVVRAAF